MPKYDYSVMAIGSGSGGGAAAFVAKRCNVKVAVVEESRDRLGGHCPNYACVPTKALLNAAKVYKMVKQASQFGIHSDNVRFDFAEVAKYRDEIVAQLTGPRIERNLHNAGIDLLFGRARFVSDHEIDVAGKRYSSEHFVIATGSKEFIPPIEGLAETGFIVSDQAVRLSALPESIIIIGAGPVGTEFAQMFSSFAGQSDRADDSRVSHVFRGNSRRRRKIFDILRQVCYNNYEYWAGNLQIPTNTYELKSKNEK